MENGKCCEYCTKHEKPECPVKNAEPWSRWKNFCSEFDKNEIKPHNLPQADAYSMLADARADLQSLLFLATDRNVRGDRINIYNFRNIMRWILWLANKAVIIYIIYLIFNAK